MPKRKAAADRLMSLGRESYASKSAIANLLKHVRNDGLPESFSRSTQYRARKEIARAMTQYGPIIRDVPMKDSKGLEVTISMQDPFATLNYVCEHSEDYARIVESALAANECSPGNPWDIIIYQDGIDPSDMGVKHHSRKSVVFYWSFGQLGQYALGYEPVWFTLCVLRHTEVMKLEGEHCMLTQTLLGLFHSRQHDITRAGVTVQLRGHAAHLFGKIRVLFADIPALKEMLSWKGHTGLKCCCLCINVLQHYAMESAPEGMVSIANADFNRLQLHTDETVRATIRRINALHTDMLNGVITKTAFMERTTILGWTWNPATYLLDRRLGFGVASGVMMDWAHIYLHDGLGDVEWGALMKILYSDRSI
jgi:hypothetical protein